MSQQATTSGGRGLRATLVFYVLLPLVLLGIVVGLLFFRNVGIIRPADQSKDADEENQLALARASLAKQSDLAGCRAAVQQLNAHFQGKASRDKLPMPPLGPAREIVKQELKLPDEDLNEVASPTFTALDAHHLEMCFLLRDVARSLELAARRADGDQTPAQLPPLKRAELAFDWVVRQVRLEPPLPPLPGQPPDDVPTPPAFVLRRGSGTPLERALVFLALLEQFSLDDDAKSGLQGVLVICPNENKQKRLWACGVTVGGAPGAVYLFDPRLGLPVPGPGGQGIATIAEAGKDAAVLGQLQAELPPALKAKLDKAKDGKAKPTRVTYDVTPEQARQAELYMATPLSALAPRMLLLQDRLLRDREWEGQLMPEAVRVRLAEDAQAARARLEKLAGVKVQFLPQAVTALRRFLPPEEGGSDKGVAFMVAQLPGFSTPDDPAGGTIPRLRLYELQAVPWSHFPPEFRNPLDLPYNVGLGQHLRDRFGGRFLQALRDPTSPRLEMLRGRLGPTSKVPSRLNLEREFWRDRRSRYEAAADTLGPKVKDWLTRAIGAYAAVLKESPGIDDATLRARVAPVWKSPLSDPIELRIDGAIAVPREAQTLFELALFKHEQAVRRQVRADLAQPATPAQLTDAKKAWEAAETYWRDFVESHAQQPGIVIARRLLAEAMARTGEPDEARQQLQAPSERMTDLDLLAHLWMAARLKPKAG